MKSMGKGLAAAVLGCCLLGATVSGAAEPAAEQGCREAVALLKERNVQISGDLRRIQREIAALRADLDRPAAKDIVGGIGYIFGLFGVAAFVASRRKEH
ncbi:MAG: hypothetical protein HKP58_13415 [Desulfatitalea sp.]|nr:hypothetical protein [Desulfatitalea sp.]NNK01399.1 hypothetical protein [Desulfatitalea sp.]